jgi:hypothetical protein
MKHALSALAVSLALIVPATAGARTVQPNFVGSGCSISTCRYFTSSYSTARYYYDRRTCSQWKTLSTFYLRGFSTAAALHNKYPNRVLHAPC